MDSAINFVEANMYVQRFSFSLSKHLLTIKSLFMAVPGFVLLKLCYLYHLQFTKPAIVDLKPPNLYTYRVWRQEFALGGQKMGEILFLRE